MDKLLSTVAAALKSGKFWKEVLIMTFGMWIAGASIYYFLVPASLVVGNVSGVSILISGVLAKFGISLKVSTVVLFINIFLILLAYVFVGKEFGLKTVYSALLLGPMMDLWELICPYTRLIAEGTSSVMGDIWFDVMAYVILLSISQAILFRINASTGGLDIIAMIVNKYFHFDIGTSVTVAGIVICCSAFAISPFQMVVIGLIGTWLNGIAIDYFTAGLNRRKRVCIISTEYDRLRKYIIENIGRGCSLYEVIGGYTGEKNMEIQSLLTQTEFAALMEYIKVNKINAFITASNVSEIYGFWLPRHKIKK